MPGQGMRRRLDALRAAGMAEEIGKIVVIRPDDWPDGIRDAYDAACAAGDTERQADVIEAQTGERPCFPRHGVGTIRDRLPPPVIEIRLRPGGPQ